MIVLLQTLLGQLFQAALTGKLPGFVDPTEPFLNNRSTPSAVLEKINAAFLISLAGTNHPLFDEAKSFLAQMSKSENFSTVASFYLQGLKMLTKELVKAPLSFPELTAPFEDLAHWASTQPAFSDPQTVAENLWTVFCPEAKGILGNEQGATTALREKRIVKITSVNPSPIQNPGREILFTSNVLLTVPLPDSLTESSQLDSDIVRQARQVAGTPQTHWYDHPIPMGVPPEKNEILYGLRGLDQAIAAEKQRGTVAPEQKCTCLLSVSVTHPGLQPLARDYLEQEVKRSGGLKHLQVYAFTEDDTQALLKEVLAPAASRYLHSANVSELLRVFGVNGHYSRHFNFLKAIAALWQVLVDPTVRATFKIDLDQVFPQKELVEQTQQSALQHLTTDLWGATGMDSRGHRVELGMLAGALVNQDDIEKSLFTPDVDFPKRPLEADEYVFFSLPAQALSTRAEMMTQYGTGSLEGKTACLQRIHVTGGTTGILIDSLRRHRPFTPSFIGRAEDQAYILSLLNHAEPQLAYLHAAGLIMRHDKHSFAAEAVEAARIGKLIGDYERILHFSGYATALTEENNHPDAWKNLKERLDPFTGAFVSRLPVTVVMLRFALKAAGCFLRDENKDGSDFIELGARRLLPAMEFSVGNPSHFRQLIRREKDGWDLYFDSVTALEEGLSRGDTFAGKIRERGRALIHSCAVTLGTN